MATELLARALPIDPANVREVGPELHLVRDLADSNLRALTHYSKVLGMPLLCFDAETESVIAQTDVDLLPALPTEVARQLAQGKGPKVLPLACGVTYFALPIAPVDQPTVWGMGYVMSRPGLRPNDFVLSAAQLGWSQAKLDHWLSGLPYCQPELLKRHLILAMQEPYQLAREAAAREQFEGMIAQLEYTYEEISLLHTLTQNMQISRAPRELARLSLERLSAVIQSEGHVVWLDDAQGQPLFLVEGAIPFDDMGMARLLARFENCDWSRPLVKNHIEGTLLGADFPGLRNLVLMPITEGNHRSGWLCSCNMSQGQEFGSVQASLLASVASILATHARNRDLFQQHEELLLCFVRTLVSSLDAKDTYTRGHSERVALVARRLGAELRLPEEDQREIYLSGLLHDIGKIGVDDEILRKPGELTKEEFEQVKKHPIIGYNILVGLKNLQSVIPGVRHHHEAYCGSGYPDGLCGEEIPLMARILAVADSYDAMGSDRPYRKGMPLEKLDRILRDGAGKQWDPRIVDAYFAARDEIKKIWESYSPLDGNLLDERSPLPGVKAIP